MNPTQFESVLRKHGVRCERLPQEWIATISSAMRGDSRYTPEELPGTFSVAESSVLSVEEWLQVYRVMLRAGLFWRAEQVRGLAQERALRDANGAGSSRSVGRALAVALEIGDFATFDELMLDDRVRVNPDLYQRAVYLRSLFDSSCVLGLPTFLEDESEFRDYVEGRSVALVGPAQTDALDAEEVHSFDRVIRLNYRETTSTREEAEKGTRCDITHFSHEQARALFDSGVQLPAGVSWVCFKGPGYLTDYASQAGHINAMHRAYDVGHNSYLFNGDYHTIPNVLLDLLRFRPARIKVFHADLMLTRKRSSGYYVEGATREVWPSESFRKMAVFHDPLTQYATMHNLWNAGRIEGDLRLERALGLGTEAYMQQLDALYGEPAQPLTSAPD